MSGGITETILAFMDKGGDVLWLIAILVFVMWTLIFERFWFFTFAWRAERRLLIDKWESRAERKSWNAKQIRSRLVSQSREVINNNMSVITTMVALCPLLGLLVAIPTVLLHTLVNGRAQRVIHLLTEQATGIIAEHSESSNK